MRQKKWIQFLKRPFVIVTTALAVITIGIFVAWSQLPWILNASSGYWLAWLNLEKAELRIVELNAEKLHVENFFLSQENWSLKANNIEASFELKDVLQNKRIHSLHIDGVIFEIKDPKAGGSNQSEEIGDQDITSIIRSALPLPFDSIELTNSSVIIERNGKTKKLAGRARIDVDAKQQGQFIAEISNSTERLKIEANLDFIDLNGEVEIQGGLETPTELLDWTYPDWRNSTEELSNATVQVGKVEYSVHFTIDNAALDNGYAKVSIEDAIFENQDHAARIHNLVIESKTKVYDLIECNVMLDLDSIQSSDLSIGTSKWTFSIAGSEMNHIEGRSDEIPWSYDQDIEGIAGLVLAVDLADDFEQSLVSFEADISELVAYDYSIESLSLRGEGSLEELEIKNTQLHLTDFPFVSSEFSSITITDPLEDLITVDLTGTLDFIEEKMDGLTLAPMSLQAQLVVSDEAQEWEAIVESNTSFPLVTYSQSDRIEGKFRHVLKGRRDSLTELITAEDEFSISELYGSFDQFDFEGVQITGQYIVSDLDIDKLQESLERDHVDFINVLKPKLVFDFSWQGNQLKIEEDTSIQWFSGYLKSEEATDAILLNATNGIVQVGAETLQQVSLEMSLSGKVPLISVKGKTALSLEGESVNGVIDGQVNIREGYESITGRFDVEPFTLVYSDIVSRHLPELEGLSFSGEIDLQTKGHWTPEDWDLSGGFSLNNGEIAYPTHSLNAKGLSTHISISSLAAGLLDSGQSIGAKSLQLGDLEAEDLAISFSMEEWQTLRVEEASVHIFDGLAHLDRAEFDIDNMDFDLMARFDEISLEPIVSQLDFFDGRMTGKVNGFVPISVKGRVVTVGEGQLTLVENSSAQLQYNAGNLFAEEDAPMGFFERYVDSFLEKSGLKPEDLVERGLNNLPIDSLQIDLFRQNHPNTPILIQMAGTAHTGPIDIPIQITTNVNGTLAEVLNFLMRLNSLGSVAILQ